MVKEINTQNVPRAATSKKGRFSSWKNVLIHPKEVFESEKNNATLGSGVVNIVIAGLILAAIASAGILFLSVPLLGGLGAILGTILSVFTFIVLPILLVIVWLIGSFVLYIISYIVGGRGRYSTLAYLMSIYLPPFLILGLLVLLPAQMFLDKLGSDIVQGVFSLFSIYYIILVLKATHGFSTGKAILAILLPYIVLFASLLGLLGTGVIPIT